MQPQAQVQGQCPPGAWSRPPTKDFTGVGDGRPGRFRFYGHYNKLIRSFDKTHSPAPQKMEWDWGNQTASRRQLTRVKCHSPGLKAQGLPRPSVQLVFQLVQDANHDLTQGLAGQWREKTVLSGGQVESGSLPAWPALCLGTGVLCKINLVSWSKSQ